MRTLVLFALCSLFFALLLSGCGFQLRGVEQASLAPELSTLRVVVEGRQPYDPLYQATVEALQSRTGVTIADAAAAVPALVLFGETFERRILAVNASTAKVSEYLLRYRLRFRIEDGQGRELAPPQMIFLEQEYTFDSLNVLAKAREDADLQQFMRQQAVQQLIRRLASIQLSRSRWRRAAKG